MEKAWGKDSGCGKVPMTVRPRLHGDSRTKKAKLQPRNMIQRLRDKVATPCATEMSEQDLGK